MKLMIVDDHAGMRDMIRQIAASPGDEICECTRGSEAVQRVGTFAPDWVTMDLRMPGISGLDATRAIMTVRPSASIVVVSSYDIAELRSAASDAGAKGFVAKDNLHELKAQIRPAAARELETSVCTSTKSTPSKTMTSSPFFFASSTGISPAAHDLPALTQTSERYRLLLENSVDVIVEATREGEILYVSSNVREVFGYSVAELMHGSIFSHVHPDDLCHRSRRCSLCPRAGAPAATATRTGHGAGSRQTAANFSRRTARCAACWLPATSRTASSPTPSATTSRRSSIGAPS